MKTYLADGAIRNELLLNLFNDNQYVTDVNILPLSSWISSQSDLRVSNFELLEAYRCVLKVKEKLVLLKPMLEYPAFIQQILSFYTSLVDYGIDLDELPEESLQEKEMKLLLKALTSMTLYVHQKNQVLNQIENCVDVSILKLAIKNYSEYRTVLELKQKGLVILDEKPIENQKVEFYSALNCRQEIEACAQMIVNRNYPLKDVNILLCNPKENLVYLKQIFAFYKLDFGVVNDTVYSKSAEAFVKLVRYFEKPQIDEFKALLYCALFEEIDRATVVEYIDKFVEELDLNETYTYVHENIDEMDLLNTNEKKRFLYLEDVFSESIEKIKSVLNVDGQVSIVKAYEVLRQSAFVNDREEKKCLLKIQSILNSCLTSDLDKTELECVLSEISKIQKDISVSFMDKICVSSLDHPVNRRKYSFVLNATSKNYPGNSALSGIFEEEYASKIKGYPSKVERSSFFNQQKEWVFQSGEQLILSYPISTYDGKGLECSFEIKRYAKKEVEGWPLIQNDWLRVSQHQLSEETARQLFVKDGKIKGSISVFERYFRCPYSFFLYSGLKLRSLSDIDISQARIGTLQHACIETCIERYGHEYAEISKDELEEIVHEKFIALKKSFRLKEVEIQSIEQRCIDSLWLQFEFLRDMEKYCDLTSHLCEVPFEKTIFASEEVAIELKGFIDRIDMNTDSFRIVDYKSSMKTLSMSKLEAGTQLQLITYLVMAEEIFEKTPLGAYYYSLKNADVPIDAAKLNLRSFDIIENNPDIWHYDWFKNHRLNGKTTDKNQANDTNGEHIRGWTKNGPSSKQLSDFDDLTYTLLRLYRILKDRLVSGNIECTPTEDACLFCDFAGICRYSGQLYKRNITKEELWEKESEENTMVEVIENANLERSPEGSN